MLKVSPQQKLLPVQSAESIEYADWTSAENKSFHQWGTLLTVDGDLQCFKQPQWSHDLQHSTLALT